MTKKCQMLRSLSLQFVLEPRNVVFKLSAQVRENVTCQACGVYTLYRPRLNFPPLLNISLGMALKAPGVILCRVCVNLQAEFCQGFHGTNVTQYRERAYFQKDQFLRETPEGDGNARSW